ncbi:diguanylate cyclase (GGDEF) domain-containing protein [Cohnella sp. OV330]|uniref:putative bifunctional diguanylate cyclase/phosphodiesterase n=1 Tax=Cohnella sp. OV330 TaxID=1855288 RepID=UPI0008E0E665|nr:EAL domain-containing protein [Cohnella sp. OV330]SFA97699.1 diguanylate cyclase (GGDEF) domain-containing protein [Cohnella sp. OV330]
MRSTQSIPVSAKKAALGIWALLLVVFAVLVILIAWSTSLYEERLVRQADQDASSELASQANSLRLAVERRLLLSESLQAFADIELMNGGNIDVSRFNAFAAHFVPAFPDVRNLSLYPNGIASYVYPLKGNEAMLGLDLFKHADPEVRDNARRTMKTKSVTLMGPLELAQGGLGLLTRQSIFVDGRFWGFSSVVLDVPALVNEGIQSSDTGVLELALRANGRLLLGDEETFEGDNLRETVKLPEGEWALVGKLKEGRLREIAGKVLTIRIFSLISVALILYLLYVQLTGKAKLDVKVRERTRELQQANETIEASNEELLAIEEELREQNRVLESKEQALRHMAYHDAVTGVYNRTYFNISLEEQTAAARRLGCKLALLYLDLDQFKLVNDTLGHMYGDMLLKEAAQRLQSVQGDQHPGLALFRIGGDEFTIILPNVEDPDEGKRLAEQVIELFRQPFHLKGAEYYLTASVGIALYPDQGEDAPTLIRHADKAMYAAKEAGKNRYKWYDGSAPAGADEQMELRSYLRKALSRGEFELHYQPQIQAGSGRLVGMEALLRWNHPKLGPVSPQRFIPLAEETGLIVEIGEWVLRVACTQNKAWQEAGFPELRMAVNLSARQFASSDVAASVRGVLEETGVDPRSLELEITENMAMKNENLPALEQLRDMGITLSIDDFGTQHSSLGYLKRLPISRIKIDRSFVSGIGKDDRDEAIIHAMMLVARRLNLSVVAEGVETEAQYDFLAEHDCDDIQGFLFYRPQPAELIRKVLLEHWKT